MSDTEHTGPAPQPNPHDRIEAELHAMIGIEQARATNLDMGMVLARNNVNILVARYIGPTLSDTPELDAFTQEAIMDYGHVLMDDPEVTSEAEADFLATEAIFHRKLKEHDVRGLLDGTVHKSETEGEVHPDDKGLVMTLLSEETAPGQVEYWHQVLDEAAPGESSQLDSVDVMAWWQSQASRTRTYEVVRNATGLFDMADKDDAVATAEAAYALAYAVDPYASAPEEKASNAQYFEELLQRIGGLISPVAKQTIRRELRELFPPLTPAQEKKMDEVETVLVGLEDKIKAYNLSIGVYNGAYDASLVDLITADIKRVERGESSALLDPSSSEDQKESESPQSITPDQLSDLADAVTRYAELDAVASGRARMDLIEQLMMGKDTTEAVKENEAKYGEYDKQLDALQSQINKFRPSEEWYNHCVNGIKALKQQRDETQLALDRLWAGQEV